MRIEFYCEGEIPDSLLIGIEIAATRAIPISDNGELWNVRIRYNEKLRVQVTPPTGPRFPALVYSMDELPSEEELATILDSAVYQTEKHLFFLSLEYMFFRQFTRYWLLEPIDPTKSDEKWRNIRNSLWGRRHGEGTSDSAESTDSDKESGIALPVDQEGRFFDPAHSETEGVRVPLHFCTNRAINPNATSLKDHYGTRRGEELRYGSCTVCIPALHRLGNIDRPRFWQVENPVRHMILEQLQELEQDRFLSGLRDEISSEDDHGAQSLLIYVHGYNVSFERAILQSAQLKYDLGFLGPVMAFSWASVGNKFGYPPDVAAAGWSVRHFATLLSVLRSSNFSKVHLIAHSLGNRIVTEALEKLSALDDKTFKLSQVVLAAPDVDRDTFLGAAGDIKKTTERITLYASDTDPALKWSGRFHLNPRAGQGGEKLVVHESIDSIDATEVHRGPTGHSYVTQSSSVLYDLYQIIQNHHGPTNRQGLFKRKNGGWHFVTRQRL